MASQRIYETESTRHVTIRQLLLADRSHSGAPFAIDEQECKIVILVANIYDLTLKAGRANYGLDDGTGRIKASRLILEGEDEQDMLNNFEQFAYARVVGELDAYNGFKSIKALAVQPLTSPYEIYYHLFHVFTDTLIYERGPPLQEEPPEDISIVEPGPSPTEQPSSSSSSSTVTYGGSTSSRLKSIESNGPVFNNELHRSIGNPEADPNRHYLPVIPTAGGTVSSLPASSISPLKEARVSARSKTPISSSKTVSSLPSNPPKYPRDSGGSKTPPSSSKTKPTPVKETPRISNTARRNDPLSNLSVLQRDIILCIKSEAEGLKRHEYIYPGARSQVWRGVDISVIIESLNSRYPKITFEEFRQTVDELLKEAYIYSPLNDNHYDCVS